MCLLPRALRVASRAPTNKTCRSLFRLGALIHLPNVLSHWQPLLHRRKHLTMTIILYVISRRVAPRNLITVHESKREFDNGTVIRSALHGVISSEATNLGPKTEISQSRFVPWLEPCHSDMTKVDLSWLSPRFWKALSNDAMWSQFRRKYGERVYLARRFPLSHLKRGV